MELIFSFPSIRNTWICLANFVHSLGWPDSLLALGSTVINWSTSMMFNYGLIWLFQANYQCTRNSITPIISQKMRIGLWTILFTSIATTDSKFWSEPSMLWARFFSYFVWKLQPFFFKPKHSSYFCFISWIIIISMNFECYVRE